MSQQGSGAFAGSPFAGGAFGGAFAVPPGGPGSPPDQAIQPAPLVLNFRFGQLVYGPGTLRTVPTFTTEAILAGEVPVRVDEFLWELLDSDGKTLGFLDVSADQVPQITVDTTRRIVRTATGLVLYQVDLSEIDVDRWRLRASMKLQNGATFALGTFMFGQSENDDASWGTRYQPELFDAALLLDQPLETTVGLQTGQSVQGLVFRLLAPFELTPKIEGEDVPTAQPLVFLAGTSRLDALIHCADLLGTFHPFFDAMGVFTYRLPPNPGDLSVTRIYDGSTVIDDTMKRTSSSYQAPNRYIVVGSDPDQPVVGIYDLPDSAANSAKARDRVVATSRTVQGLTDLTAADHLAWLDALTDRTSFGHIAFSATADPRHGAYDTLLVTGGPYIESSWTLNCVSGGHHDHNGATLWPS